MRDVSSRLLRRAGIVGFTKSPGNVLASAKDLVARSLPDLSNTLMEMSVTSSGLTSLSLSHLLTVTRMTQKGLQKYSRIFPVKRCRISSALPEMLSASNSGLTHRDNLLEIEASSLR